MLAKGIKLFYNLKIARPTSRMRFDYDNAAMLRCFTGAREANSPSCASRCFDERKKALLLKQVLAATRTDEAAARCGSRAVPALQSYPYMKQKLFDVFFVSGCSLQSRERPGLCSSASSGSSYAAGTARSRWGESSYYRLLGVTPDCSDDELKKASVFFIVHDRRMSRVPSLCCSISRLRNAGIEPSIQTAR